MVRIPQAQLDIFRRRLVELVAVESRFSRSLPPDPDAQLADDLGVTMDVLADAIQLRRTGFRMPPSRNVRAEMRRGYLYYSWCLWTVLGEPVAKAARRRDENETTFIRSLLHAFMQTTFEPVTRARPEGARTDPHHRSLPISRALHYVLCRRAAALGTTTSLYCSFWVYDYLNGRLPPIKVVPISAGQCFDDPALYAVPVFAGQEVADGPPAP